MEKKWQRINSDGLLIFGTGNLSKKRTVISKFLKVIFVKITVSEKIFVTAIIKNYINFQSNVKEKFLKNFEFHRTSKKKLFIHKKPIRKENWPINMQTSWKISLTYFQCFTKINWKYCSKNDTAMTTIICNSIFCKKL